jgi:hypothetical protein
MLRHVFLGVPVSTEEAVKNLNARYEHLKDETPMIETRVFRQRLMVKSDLQGLLVGHGKIIHLAEDRQGLNQIDIWFESTGDDKKLHASKFAVVGTGDRVPYGFEHVGTVVMKNELVWHIYRQFECPIC